MIFVSKSVRNSSLPQWRHDLPWYLSWKEPRPPNDRLKRPGCRAREKTREWSTTCVRFPSHSLFLRATGNLVVPGCINYRKSKYLSYRTYKQYSLRSHLSCWAVYSSYLPNLLPKIVPPQPVSNSISEKVHHVGCGFRCATWEVHSWIPWCFLVQKMNDINELRRKRRSSKEQL